MMDTGTCNGTAFGRWFVVETKGEKLEDIRRLGHISEVISLHS